MQKHSKIYISHILECQVWMRRLRGSVYIILEFGVVTYAHIFVDITE